MIELELRNDVFHLTMLNGEDNRFNPSFVKSLHQALDQVENTAFAKRGTPCALITTSKGKFYSNGLDVKYLFESGDKWFISDQYLPLLKRMLTFPVITVAGTKYSRPHCP
jgi:enoyl-CoA hydratase/carnithine racemase